MINIKVNGTNISIENSNVVTSDSLDSLNKSIESLNNQIDKEYIALKLMSNIKAVESFGYRSTEGVGEKIKAGANRVWEAIKNFFIKIGKWFKKIFNKQYKEKAKSDIQNSKIISQKNKTLALAAIGDTFSIAETAVNTSQVIVTDMSKASFEVVPAQQDDQQQQVSEDQSKQLELAKLRQQYINQVSKISNECISIIKTIDSFCDAHIYDHIDNINNIAVVEFNKNLGNSLTKLRQVNGELMKYQNAIIKYNADDFKNLQPQIENLKSKIDSAKEDAEFAKERLNKIYSEKTQQQDNSDTFANGYIDG